MKSGEVALGVGVLVFVLIACRDGEERGCCLQAAQSKQLIWRPHCTVIDHHHDSLAARQKLNRSDPENDQV